MNNLLGHELFLTPVLLLYITNRQILTKTHTGVRTHTYARAHTYTYARVGEQRERER